MAERDLPFLLPTDADGDIAERLRQSYAALPPADAARVSACAAAVLDDVRRGVRPPALASGSPRLLRPRWWWGAAAAAVLVVVISKPWRPDVSQQQADSVFTLGSSVSAPVGATSEERGAIRFDLQLPSDARAVSIVGDFNGWDERATPMLQRREDGSWSARVPLPPGRHVYAFVVDGTRWLVDPLAPQVPDAGYGPANAVIVDRR
jgi:hypothetical protein